MRVLVTGGSGFIGANLVDALLAAGHEVVSMERPGTPPPPAGVRVIAADVYDPGAVGEAINGVDAVVHCAATTPSSGADLNAARRAFAINLGGTVNVVQACETHAARLLYLSSASVYGTAGHGPLDEVTTCPQPTAAYGISKLAAERFVASRRTHGLQAAVLRLGSVFGPHERNTGLRDTLSAPFQVIRAARLGQAIRLPRAGLRDWIYARDAAGAILTCLNLSELPDVPVNIAGLQEWTVADWCRSLARHLDMDWDVDAAAPTIDFHGADDRPPLATARMQTLLGFSPRYDTDRACADYLEWLKEHDPT
ncbi:NAD-dependent epimerase/dehydratase family protein [Oceanibium sediminis]|uniref:NAD-dependent epimerase/dehydratase family protein n=1 Tax=Oceanibium sediminis TaxID=2026339 RepID=UPI000DD3B94B|nr:NAD(P)-dependent oxidoreductase [Oceanibium sediminis]